MFHIQLRFFSLLNSKLYSVNVIDSVKKNTGNHSHYQRMVSSTIPLDDNANIQTIIKLFRACCPGYGKEEGRCIECPLGTYRGPSFGDGPCINCPAGKTTHLRGMSKAFNCGTL